MKKLFLILGLILFSVCIFAQDSIVVVQNPSLKALAQTTYGAIIDAAGEVLALIDWTFLIILLACASFFNETVETESFALFLSGMKKVPRGLRTFILGVLMIILFCWAYSVKNKLEIFSYIITLFAGMIMLSIGLNKLIRIATTKFGFKF